MYETPAARLKELINNAYDADAKHVEVFVKPDADRVIILDDGHGEEFVRHFSRISESYKREAGDIPPLGRKKIDKIGIGFVAANEHLGAERTAREAGWNRSEIEVQFNLSQVPGKNTSEEHDRFGATLVLRKTFTWRTFSDTVLVEYHIGTITYEFDDLPEDVQKLIEVVSISYIHPQEGTVGLRRAQDMFKQRLFYNWGGHASVADKLKAVQDKWDELRNTANSYLSAALTQQFRAPGDDFQLHCWLTTEFSKSVPRQPAVQTIRWRHV